jgi:polysaccharide deacetylase family protein (PEP-CTERM system associated)
MTNALTVDLEDWYHICGVEGYSDPLQWEIYENRVIRNTEKILGLLRKYKVKATFFVLGYIAFKEPSLVKTVRNEGHEIATHGFYHRRIFEMTEQEFEEDLLRSISEISAITGERVLGFRAPEWSVRNDTLWMFDLLKKHGVLYDSSMVPLTRMGSRDFPCYPSRFDTAYGKIWEFPLTTTRLFWENIPFSGGLPLRLTPYFYIYERIRRLNRKGYPAMVYVHPWEFDLEQPMIDLPLSRKFMHYFNIKAAPKKIEGLLQHFKFVPVRDILPLVH